MARKNIASSHGVVESVYGESFGQQGRVLGSKIIRADNKKTQPNFTAAPESGSGSAKAKAKKNKKKGASKGKSGAAGAGGANGKKAGVPNEPQVLDPAAIKKRQRKAKEAFRTGRVLLEKLVEGSDLVLVVLDARDPQRCRSTFLEQLVKKSGKSLVFVLNKTDLVPRHNVERWLEVLRQEYAAVAFNAVEESPSSSADALAQLVKAQATTSSDNTKPSIAVGIVGFPSVGRASVLRSLRQSKELASNSSMVKFYVNLGALLNKGGHGPIDSMLRSKLLPGEDLVAATASILMRCKQQTLMITYSVPRFDTGLECLAALSRQQGHLFKGGIPDTLTTARSFLRELGSGKSPFFTNPPTVKRTMEAIGYGLSAEDDGFVLDEMVFSGETTGFSFVLAAQKGVEEDPEDSGDEVEEEAVEAPMLVPTVKEKQSKPKKQATPEPDMGDDEDEDADEEEEEEEEEEVAHIAPITTKRGAKSAPVQKRPIKKAKKSAAASEEDGNAPYAFGEFA
ncbi:hypothetical protein EC957_010983 [Mortierella hygrophila]|uniref:Uncharacterized protein n=1 Tax=Mortierella hygrophila TaxID=979708 RepID=A0A9P6F9A9_9FUNG|nr:hypothetical protein EC957_010983 [Mortierella hygrophila]